MANFNEGTPEYDWSEGVYVIEKSDPVEGGADGISNRQAKELTRRTRNLHKRLTELKQEAVEIASELTALTEAVDTKDAAALNSAKAYSDQKDTAVRNDFAAADTTALQSAKSYADTKDTAALQSAKSYADTVVAALVEGSPEALNTLNELADALGNDPNFATTVMTEIGKRVTTEAFNTAMGGKFDKTGGAINGEVILNAPDALGGRFLKQQIGGYDSVGLHFNRSVAAGIWSQLDVYTRGGDGFQKRAEISENGLKIAGKAAWHSGNFDPVTKAAANHTHPDATPTAAGLMPAADKEKINTLNLKAERAGVIDTGGHLAKSFTDGWSSSKVADGSVKIWHDIGHTNYIFVGTAHWNGNVSVTIQPGTKLANTIQVNLLGSAWVNAEFEFIIYTFIRQ